MILHVHGRLILSIWLFPLNIVFVRLAHVFHVAGVLFVLLWLCAIPWYAFLNLPIPFLMDVEAESSLRIPRIMLG